MNFKTLIETELEHLRQMGKTRRVIEAEMGYSENYIDQTLSRGGNKKMLEALSVYKEKVEAGRANALMGEGKPYGAEISDKTLSMQAVLSLTRSNEKLANANADLSRSNLELTQLIKTFASNALESSSAASPIIGELLGLIAEVGSGKTWHSKDEALAALNKRLFAAHKVQKAGDILRG